MRAQLVVEYAVAPLARQGQRRDAGHVLARIEARTERELIRKAAVERDEALVVGADEIDAAGDHIQRGAGERDDQHPGNDGPEKPTPPAAWGRSGARGTADAGVRLSRAG